MKLLIVTQVVDSNHSVLGFFHRWIEEFAKHCEAVHVVCLEEGTHHLPKHVLVHSLGKEQGMSRFVRLVRFYKLTWSLRNEYDAVFVHMNPEYVLGGFIVWRTLRKKIGFWYAHGAVTYRLRVAVKAANFVFTSTKEGCRVVSDKVKVVGQGIDCEFFSANYLGEASRAITVGRISRVKNIEILIQAIHQLRDTGVDMRLDIYGLPLTDEDKKYQQEIYQMIKELKLQDIVTLQGSCMHSALPALLHKYLFFLSAGQTGSLDKAILEAAATARVVVSSNSGSKDFLQSGDLRLGVQNTPEDFAQSIGSLLNDEKQKLSKIREKIANNTRLNHDVQRLCKLIIQYYGFKHGL